MKKTLITGATGGLGSAVVSFLKAQNGIDNLSVLVRDREGSAARDFRAQGIDVRTGDYNDVDSLYKAFSGIEVLYFVSGNDIEARVSQHENVVRAAVESGVKHILYTSTVRKDESAESPLYPVTNGHIQTEKRIRESGMAFTLLRHNLYGEVIPLFAGDKDRLLQSETIYLPAGRGKTAFVPRTELAEAAANILADAQKHENSVYELNGGECVGFEQIAALITEITGKHITYVSPEIGEFESALASQGLPGAVVAMLSMFSLAIARGEFDSQSQDLEKLLGRKPQSLAAYLRQLYA